MTGVRFTCESCHGRFDADLAGAYLVGDEVGFCPDCAHEYWLNHLYGTRPVRETWKLRADLELRNVHTSDRCAGRGCCLHHPSDHHMADWPLIWRSDRHLMERMCVHGVGHPDPDDVAFQDPDGELGVDIHGCCAGRCCSTPEAT
jgi:hypothetical protein